VKLEKPQRGEPLLPSEQMKAWSAALDAELSEWPEVTLKAFFGFTALYRGKSMFGLLPRTRSIFKGNAVAFRLNAASGNLQSRMDKDPRIAAFDKDKARWFTFELCSDRDLHEALEYIAKAFEQAGIRRKKK
jgi:hypothetical protein